ncbi:DUF4252 domain-containing protein [Flavobacterium coralii]|uniref:DUF4252 domain-containing protein n=1 Tax=Flavobacterium coralii TaxID=2838017 RepID=UPI000C37BCA3|nr:hypothetical protein [Flavobacterium sp.]|tara:strand:- start:23925 stop:24392 length:468 start_codon:yes stop_codon:yes gene_type:complete
MKKFIITAALAAMPLLGFAQKEFDQFEDKDGIDSVVIREKLMDILGNIEISGTEEAKGYLDNVRSMESLRVFTTKDRQYALEMETTVASYLKKKRMDELMSVNSDGKNVKVYTVSGTEPSDIKELLLLSKDAKDNEVVLVTFVGDISLKNKKNNY